jgi:hypothetical protein
MKLKVLLFFGIIMLGIGFAQYEVGQIWQYETRKGEEKSLLYIVRIDEIENYGKIYHIYVDRLEVKNPHSKTGFQTELPHAPVDEQTLNESVIKLVKNSAELPDISEGYGYWREAFDSGQGGVFTISVKDIVQLIEEAANQQQ